LPFVIVATYGIVVGVSRLGLARIGEAEEFEEVRNFSPRHSKDALLAITAKREGAVFVTNERRLTNFARRAGIEVLSSEEFAASIAH
jgi:predicted nucleic acid-binding protein